MKIAFISYEFPPDTGKGGIGTYVKQIAEAVASLKHEVHVFAGTNQSDISKCQDNYWIHLVQCRDTIEFRNKVVEIFEIQNALHSFDLMESPEINGNAWEIKKRFMDIPLVVRFHAPDYLVESLKKTYVPVFAKLRFVFGALKRFKWDMGYWRKYNKAADADYEFIQLADAITAPSNAMKEWGVKNWEIAPKSICVIPNLFTPPDAFLNIPISTKNKFKRIVFFGRLNVLKGLVNASMAMKEILTKYPDWKFRVIGDNENGPYAEITMRDWMKNNMRSVISQVEFLDGINYEAIPAAITEAEIVLLPSLFESFSYTCIEAMAAGKAVVGSNSGGMKDLLQNEESGFLIDPENYKGIYAAIEKLILNSELRYNMSRNARGRVLKDFNSTSTVEKMIGFYNRVIEAAK